MSVDTTHYDTFECRLSPKDINKGTIRLDPYKVAEVWGVGTRDPSGALFHILKTVSRYDTKVGNTKLRELHSIKATVERLIELVEADQELEQLTEISGALTQNI